MSGRDEIRDFLSALPLAGVKNVSSQPVIDVDGETAVATSEWIALDTSQDSLRLVAGGRYHDRLVRLHGRWLFSERRNVRWAGI